MRYALSGSPSPVMWLEGVTFTVVFPSGSTLPLMQRPWSRPISNDLRQGYQVTQHAPHCPEPSSSSRKDDC